MRCLVAESEKVAPTPRATSASRCSGGRCQGCRPVVNHDVTYPRDVTGDAREHSRYVTWPRGTRERSHAHLDPLATVVTDQRTAAVSLYTYRDTCVGSTYKDGQTTLGNVYRNSRDYDTPTDSQRLPKRHMYIGEKIWKIFHPVMTTKLKSLISIGPLCMRLVYRRHCTLCSYVHPSVCPSVPYSRTERRRKPQKWCERSP